MGTNKNAGKAAAKAAKKIKQADKAAKKESQAIKAASTAAAKGKGKKADNDEEEDLEAILERYQAEMQAVRSTITLRNSYQADMDTDSRSHRDDSGSTSASSRKCPAPALPIDHLGGTEPEPPLPTLWGVLRWVPSDVLQFRSAV